MQPDYRTIVTNFVYTLQNRISAEEILSFYHPDVEQIEFPNVLTQRKVIRNLNELRDGLDQGRQVLQKEEYQVIKLYSVENTVIMEAIWTGTLAIPIGSTPVGGQIQAYFAQFYEFKEDKIIRQRNYDCFEPF
ncbi:hypothetical protein BH09BAC4_BH09BAC4_07410 [soil metagenome]